MNIAKRYLLFKNMLLLVTYFITFLIVSGIII